MEKINFVNNQAPAINGANLNQLQANIENAIEEKYIYSTTEQSIGSWIDGKPLYRKVLSTGTLETSGEKSIDCGKNIASFVHVYGQATGVLENGVPINYHMPDKDIGLRISYSRYILISNGAGIELTDGFVIIEYTKTTD